MPAPPPQQQQAALAAWPAWTLGALVLLLWVDAWQQHQLLADLAAAFLAGIWLLMRCIMRRLGCHMAARPVLQGARKAHTSTGT